MATATKKKSTKKAKKVKRVGCANKPRSAAEQKLVDADKASSSKTGSMVRWLPTHAGLSFKDQAFEAWLKNPADPELAAKLHERFKLVSLSSLRKWLNNFGSGCKRVGTNYPRGAKGRVKEIRAALKKSTGATISKHALEKLS